MSRVVVAGVMGPRKEAGGKNWTKSEIAAREAGAEKVTRKIKKRLRPPDWLSLEALVVWKRIIRQTRDLEMLDVLDEYMLAVYCDIYVQYAALSGQVEKSIDEIKSQQSLARLMSSYADKLGLTPASRARLAKKVADQVIDDFGSEFD